MWAEFVLVLDPAPKVFLRVLLFSSLSKNRHAAYSSWLLAVLQGHARGWYRIIESSVNPVKKDTGDTASVGLTLSNTLS